MQDFVHQQYIVFWVCSRGLFEFSSSLRKMILSLKKYDDSQSVGRTYTSFEVNINLLNSRIPPRILFKSPEKWCLEDNPLFAGTKYHLFGRVNVLTSIPNEQWRLNAEIRKLGQRNPIWGVKFQFITAPPSEDCNRRFVGLWRSSKTS